MKKICMLLVMSLTLGFSNAQSSQEIIKDNEGKTTAKYQKVNETTVSAQFFYKDGKLKEVGVFVDNKREGKWVSYTRSGQQNVVGFYIDGKKTGLWQFWDLEGRLSHQVDYTKAQPEMMVLNQK